MTPFFCDSLRPTKLEQNVKDLQETTKNPDIVFLGSSFLFWPLSQMVSTPIDDLQITFRPEMLDLPSLAEQTKIYNLSNNYQMISDQCIWVDEFLVGKNKPSWVVLGCAPRDFYDTDVVSPVLTENFISTASYQNLPQYVSMIKPSTEDFLNSMFSKTVPLYNKRTCIKQKLGENLNAFCGSVGLANAISTSARPTIWTLPKSAIWNESLNEYRHRYWDIGSAKSIKKQELQFSFLERLLQSCRRWEIRVLIVNMPIQNENLKLLPQGYYDEYREHLKQTSISNHADFLDLHKDLKLARSDFDDTIHLNYVGGRKLFSSIFQYLEQHDGSSTVSQKNFRSHLTGIEATATKCVGDRTAPRTSFW